MKKNMGGIDKALRILIAFIIVILWMAGVLSGTIATVLLVVSIIFILTSMIGVCPLYLPFGISTRRANK